MSSQRLNAKPLLCVILLFVSVGHSLLPVSTKASSVQMRIVDGDTLVLNGERIRLYGIDAPELRQSCLDANGQIYGCGQLAKRHLIGLIDGKAVRCRGNNQDKYRRRLAVCYAGRMNVNKRMVEDGWALAYGYYSKVYIKEQIRARQKILGMWQGRF